MNKQILLETIEWIQSGGNPEQVNWENVRQALDRIADCPCGLRDCCKRDEVIA